MPSASQAIRMFAYPLLEAGNLSFPEGDYAPQLQATADGYVDLEHKISGAPLIESMLTRKLAVCACVFAVPITGYRRLLVADTLKQKIEWEHGWVGEPPYFHPLILCSEKVTHILKKSDGVHETWVGQKAIFEKGAKIALGPHFRLKSSLQSLLSIEMDERLGKGQMKVEACTEGGFFFRVGVADDLHAFLMRNQSGTSEHYAQCRSIYTHAVSSCFEVLKREYGDGDDWQAFPNLQALAGEMDKKGVDSWAEDDFCAEEAATKMYPHVVRAEAVSNE